MLIQIDKFSGTAPKIIDPALLGNHAQAAKNCRFDRGGVAPINGDLTIQPSGLELTGDVLSMFLYYPNPLIETPTYQVNFLEWITDVDAVRTPIANDSYERVFYTEAGVLKVTDKNLFTQVGDNYPLVYKLPCPPAPVNALVASGTPVGSDPTLIETRGYVYTCVNGYGEEGPPSPVSNLIDLYDGNTCNLSGMDTASGIDAHYDLVYKRIYRINMSASGTAQYQFVVEIAVATTTYTDTMLNADLGEILPSAEWDEAPAGITGLINLPGGVLAGVVPDQKIVCFSVPNYPHAWPVVYQKATERKPVGLGNFGQTTVALTEGQPYVITGGDPANMSAEKADIDYSCMSKRGIVNFGATVIFPAPQGIVAINPEGADLLTKDIFTVDQWKVNYNPSSIHAYPWEDKYIGFYYREQNNVAVFWGGFLFDPKTRDFVDLDFYATGGYFNPADGTLYLAINDNIVAFNMGAEQGVISMLGMRFIGIVAADPDTTGWGTDHEGYCWYNSTDHHLKYWNSTEIVLM